MLSNSLEREYIRWKYMFFVVILDQQHATIHPHTISLFTQIYTFRKYVSFFHEDYGRFEGEGGERSGFLFIF